MASGLPKLGAAPDFDLEAEYREHQRRLVQVMLGLGIAHLVSSSLQAWGQGRAGAPYLGWGALALFYCGLLALAHGGYARAASWLYVALAIPLLLGSAWRAGGIHGPNTLGFLSLVLLAGLLLNWRVAVVVAGVSIVGLGAGAYAEAAGWMRPLAFDPWDRWSVLSWHIVFATVIQSVAYRRMGAALARSQRELEMRRETEGKLAEANRVLREQHTRLLEAARVKSEFLRNMSHELRTPMHGVMGMISLARDQVREEEAGEYLDLAAESAQSLLRMVNDILDYAKIEAARMKLAPEVTLLKPLVAETVRMFEPQARAKGIELRWEVHADCPEAVEADGGRLRQILVNLLGNAVKFTERGWVGLAVEPGEGGLRFTVADTGIGMAEDGLERIFEPFTQIDGSIGRRYGGTGMGLAISRELARLMGGEIEVTSRLGEGSRFRLDVPLAAASAPAEREAEGEAKADLRGLRVLVAEDNRISQRVMESLLSREGCEVVSVGDGRLARQATLEERFDLILMDIQMPVMDGLVAAALIREDEARLERGRVPIIGVTAHAGRSDLDRCLEAGMDVAVSKPVMLAELLELAAALTRRG